MSKFFVPKNHFIPPSFMPPSNSPMLQWFYLLGKGTPRRCTNKHKPIHWLASSRSSLQECRHRRVFKTLMYRSPSTNRCRQSLRVEEQAFITTDSEDLLESPTEQLGFFRPRTTAKRHIQSAEPSPMTMVDNNIEFPFPKQRLMLGRSVHGQPLEPPQEEERLSRWERQPGDPATFFANQYKADVTHPSFSTDELQNHDPRDIVDHYLRNSMNQIPLTLQQPPRPKVWTRDTDVTIVPAFGLEDHTVETTLSRVNPEQAAEDEEEIIHQRSLLIVSGTTRQRSLSPRIEQVQARPNDANAMKLSIQSRDYRRWEIEHAMIPPPLSLRNSPAPSSQPPVSPPSSPPSATTEGYRLSSFSSPSTPPSMQFPLKSDHASGRRSLSSARGSGKASDEFNFRSDARTLQHASKKYPGMPQPEAPMHRRISTYANSKRESMNNTLADMYDTLERMSMVPKGIRPALKLGSSSRSTARKSREMRSPAIPITPYQRDGPAAWEQSEMTSPTSRNDKSGLFEVGKKKFASVKKWVDERKERNRERKMDELRASIRVLGPAGEKNGHVEWV